jgi:acetyltransferase
VHIERMIVRKNAREVMVGLIRDAAFGPAITFGAGGTAVEILRDRAVALPPLNSYLVEQMVSSTRVSRLLGAYRNLPPVDMPALASVLLRVSEMACELPSILELDINPLIVDESGAIAVDARVVIGPVIAARSRYAHLAIHPYPSYVTTGCRLADGTPVMLRPIRPEDAAMEQEFVQRLSNQSRYLRFMGSMRELTPAMLRRFTQIDYDREMAIVAVKKIDGCDAEIAVARYVINPDGNTCEFAIVVGDEYQKLGLGRQLMELLIKVARQQGLQSMLGHILSNNTGMLALCPRLGAVITNGTGEFQVKQATLSLAACPDEQRLACDVPLGTQG